MRTNWKLNLFMFMALLVASSIPAMAENRKGVVYHITDTDEWVAAVESKYFEPYVARQPNNSNWCWAASVQMVLNYQGVDIDQKKIVLTIKHRLVDKEGETEGGTTSEIARATNGHEVGCYTIRSIPQQYEDEKIKDINVQGILDDLVNKYPLVVGLVNPRKNSLEKKTYHAWVLTGLWFKKSGNKVIPTKVILRDPWPENESKQTMSWENFLYRLESIVHVFPVDNGSCSLDEDDDVLIHYG